MSQRPRNTSNALDLWSIVENETVKTIDNDAIPSNEADVNDDDDNIVLFLGDGASGKSSLIQQFLKPNILHKDPKPTVV